VARKTYNLIIYFYAAFKIDSLEKRINALLGGTFADPPGRTVYSQYITLQTDDRRTTHRTISVTVSILG